MIARKLTIFVRLLCQVQVAEVASKSCDTTNNCDSDNTHTSYLAVREITCSRLYFPEGGGSSRAEFYRRVPYVGNRR